MALNIFLSLSLYNVSTMKHLFDNSHELLLCRYRNGVKLIRPENTKTMSPMTKPTGHNVKDILAKPFCTYFTNVNTRNVHINDVTVEACGFSSSKDALYQTLYKVMHRKSVDKIVHDNQIIMKSNKQKFLEHVSIRKDNVAVPTLSLTTPWYNDENKIIGIFGCTIVFGKQPLADTLSHIMDLGISSNTNSIENACGRELNSIYFSKRELECIELTLLGKPAKEVGFILRISQRTVEEYLGNIKTKLNVSTKAAMIEKLHAIFRTF